jgi:hypothetical protein
MRRMERCKRYPLTPAICPSTRSTALFFVGTYSTYIETCVRRHCSTVPSSRFAFCRFLPLVCPYCAIVCCGAAFGIEVESTYVSRTEKKPKAAGQRATNSMPSMQPRQQATGNDQRPTTNGTTTRKPQ